MGAYEAQFQGTVHCLAAIVDTQLLKNLLQMKIHRMHRVAKLIGDYKVLKAPGQLSQDEYIFNHPRPSGDSTAAILEKMAIQLNAP